MRFLANTMVGVCGDPEDIHQYARHHVQLRNQKHWMEVCQV